MLQITRWEEKRQRGIKKPKPHAQSFLRHKETLERGINARPLLIPSLPPFVGHLSYEDIDALSLHLLKPRGEVQVIAVADSGAEEASPGGVLGRGQV